MGKRGARLCGSQGLRVEAGLAGLQAAAEASDCQGFEAGRQGLRLSCQGLRLSCQGLRLSCQGSRLSCQGLRLGCQGSRLGCQGLRLGCQGLRLGCQVSRLGCQGLRLGCQGLRLGCQGLRLGCQVLGLGYQGLGLGCQVLGLGCQGLGLGCQGLRLVCQGLRLVMHMHSSMDGTPGTHWNSKLATSTYYARPPTRPPFIPPYTRCISTAGLPHSPACSMQASSSCCGQQAADANHMMKITGLQRAAASPGRPDVTLSTLIPEPPALDPHPVTLKPQH